ncbi:DUF563 domain-containing protein [Acetobacter musti]|uniref:DUF563 domain-containing protein n=1 Tax=Acetobacter musti TaxID=864732 RepID=A0ABX0JPB0_9PROT|nr:DUF563 domain-containing protein [Acetobacter musti]
MTEGFEGVADIREVAGDNQIHFGTRPPRQAEPPVAESLLLARGLRSPRPDPAFIYGEFPEESLRHYRGQDGMPDVYVYGLRDVTVIGPWFRSGALLVQNGIRLKCNDIALNPEDEASLERFSEDIAERRAGNRVLRAIDEPVVLLATNGHQIFGHWLVDFLPKFHLLALAGISLNEVRILLPTNMGAFARDMMLTMGIREDQLLEHDPDAEVLQCRTLIVPTTLRQAGRCHPMYADAVATINEMIDRTRAVPDASLRRIFVTRGPQFGRRLYGIVEAEEIARAHDFTIVRPEELPISEQIALFRGAREIVGPYGSALHSSIFSRPGAKVAAIHAQLPQTFDVLQSGISERIGQITGYIFGKSVPDDPTGIRFDAPPFRACLDEQFSHPNFRKETLTAENEECPNIARHRPAMQSSISFWSVAPTREEDAAQGVNGVISGKNCFQTKVENGPWWQVDLGGLFDLREIRLFNRMGTADVMARVAALGIAVSRNGTDWTTIMTPTDHGLFGGADGAPLVWRPGHLREPASHRRESRITARWVKVFLESRDSLSLEQVEVYGVPAGDGPASSEPGPDGPLSGLLPEDVFSEAPPEGNGGQD